jgi:uncharacterized protein (TIGR02284 family)
MAATQPQDIYEPLHDLVQLDFDAIKAYADAIAHIDDAAIRRDLESFKADHQRHIQDLTAVIAELGGKPSTPGTDFKGFLLEGMTRLRSLTGTKGALKAMRSNERLSNKAYEKASRLDLPARAHEVVARNLEDERRHLASIVAHLERLETEARRGEPVAHP